ncbi:MAG: hypothetical protein ACI9KE_004676 [Polyangiales bacterium]|jgi:hypothetical protein
MFDLASRHSYLSGVIGPIRALKFRENPWQRHLSSRPCFAPVLHCPLCSSLPAATTLSEVVSASQIRWSAARCVPVCRRASRTAVRAAAAASRARPAARELALASVWVVKTQLRPSVVAHASTRRAMRSIAVAAASLVSREHRASVASAVARARTVAQSLMAAQADPTREQSRETAGQRAMRRARAAADKWAAWGLRSVCAEHSASVQLDRLASPAVRASSAPT